MSRRDNVASAQLLDLCNVACDRLGRDEIDLATERGLFLLAVEVTFGAVALQASDRARVTCLCVKVGCLFNSAVRTMMSSMAQV